MRARPEASGTWAYTWEEVTIPLSALQYTIELDIAWRASRYLPAKTQGDPEDCHPAEGGNIEVESVTVTDIEATLSHHGGGETSKKFPLKPSACRYWQRRFEKEMEPDPGFISQLSDHVAHEEEH